MGLRSCAHELCMDTYRALATNWDRQHRGTHTHRKNARTAKCGFPCVAQFYLIIGGAWVLHAHFACARCGSFDFAFDFFEYGARLSPSLAEFRLFCSRCCRPVALVSHVHISHVPVGQHCSCVCARSHCMALCVIRRERERDRA